MEFLFILSPLFIYINSVTSSLYSSSGQPVLNSVSRFPNIENFYAELRNRPSSSSSEPTTSTPIKLAICRDIFRSDLFNSAAIEPVEDDKLFDELRKKKNQDIFQQIYEKTSDHNTLVPTFWSNPSKNYSYKNDYLSRPISFEDKRHTKFKMSEYVFVCVTRHRLRDGVDPWYVSKEYNMVVGNNPSGEYIVGRFIFQLKAENLKLVALAEESAKEFIQYGFSNSPYNFNVNNDYTAKRRDNVLAEKPELDPVCRLTDQQDQHIRLCTSVISSSYFGRRAIFLSEKSNSLKNCRQKNVWFTAKDLSNTQTSYIEWMTTCAVRWIQNGDEFHYYISRAYEPNKVYVYRRSSKGDAVLKTLMTRISIDDAAEKLSVKFT